MIERRERIVLPRGQKVVPLPCDSVLPNLASNSLTETKLSPTQTIGPPFSSIKRILTTMKEEERTVKLHCSWKETWLL